jgi:glycosyltransferase involved in cell wall biosynthesis
MLQPELLSSADLSSYLIYFTVLFSALYILRFFIHNYKLAFLKSNLSPASLLPPLTVIVCARDEADNLTNFLPEILAQDYPEFEVIVVNDCSNDHTDDVLREFARLFPNLKVITIKEDDYYKHGKKFALMVGIKGAKFEHLVLTDADCVPSSRQWLKGMSSGFSATKEIVLGYGAYQNEDGFLNKLIRFDTMLIGISYLSAALRNKPYMGVGRNLAYKKDLFFRSRNFSKHYHLISGDDDLFINQVATKENTAIVLDSNSFTYSIPKRKFGQWWRQKQRHLTTAPFYGASSRLQLGITHFLNYISFFSCLVCLFFPSTHLYGASGLAIRWMVQLIIYVKVAKVLNEKGIIAYWIVFDFLLLLIYPLISFTQKISRPAKWMN